VRGGVPVEVAEGGAVGLAQVFGHDDPFDGEA